MEVQIRKRTSTSGTRYQAVLEIWSEGNRKVITVGTYDTEALAQQEGKIALDKYEVATIMDEVNRIRLDAIQQTEENWGSDPPNTGYLPSWSLTKFLRRIEKTDTCWLWTGGTNEVGYGTFGNKQTRYAHRVAYRLWIGYIPEDLEVHHLCYVRTCVYPGHLALLTHAENVRDSHQRRKII